MVEVRSWEVGLDGKGLRRFLVAVRAVVDAVELDVDRGGNAHVDRKFVAIEADRLAAVQHRGVKRLVGLGRIEVGHPHEGILRRGQHQPLVGIGWRSRRAATACVIASGAGGATGGGVDDADRAAGSVHGPAVGLPAPTGWAVPASERAVGGVDRSGYSARPVVAARGRPGRRRSSLGSTGRARVACGRDGGAALVSSEGSTGKALGA